MYWQDDTEESTRTVSDEIVDVVFHVQGRELPCDHAWALMNAIREQLPWFGEHPHHGLHLIHPAASGNGWYSPEDSEGGTMYLPRRARLTLRVPKEMVEQAASLEGSSLDIDGYQLTVGQGDVRLLSLHTTLHARHVLSGADDPTELGFLAWVSQMVNAMGIQGRKMVAGRESTITTPEGTYRTRSLLLADLRQEEALRLQQRGVGGERRLGCGVFIPHKAVRDLFVEN